MELLSSALEFSSWLGEFVDRVEDKEQELAKLSSTVVSISQSMRSFANCVAPSERDKAFHSNEVFMTILRHVQACEVIIDKRRQAALENQQALMALESSYHSEANLGRLGMLKRGVSQVKSGGLELCREASAMLGGKLGSNLSVRLNLPEDELATIRASALELQRLVPMLQLAIQTYHCRQEPTPQAAAQRDGDHLPAAKRLRLGDREQSESREMVHFIDICPLRLQLVSEDPRASGSSTFQELHASELRATSSSSNLTSAEGNASEASCQHPRQRVFGRRELQGKIDACLNLPSENGGAPLPPWRFVSRDLFRLEVPEKPSSSSAAEAADSLEMATLAFGGGGGVPFVPSSADDTATLQMGGGSQRPPGVKDLLATVTSLSNSGLHIRLAGETTWMWKAKDSAVVLYEGDRLALLLESPPGSFKPGPTTNLSAEEAVCLLGLDLRPPLEET